MLTIRVCTNRTMGLKLARIGGSYMGAYLGRLGWVRPHPQGRPKSASGGPCISNGTFLGKL